MASSSDAASSAITIHLSLTSSPSSPRVSLSLDPHATTASDLRRKASSVTSVPLSSLKLIFRGRMITDKDEGDVAKEFKLEDGCVVHVMGKPADAAAGGAASAASNGSIASSSASGASVSIPSANTDDAVRGGAAARGIPSPADAAIAKLRSSNDAATCRTALATADKLLGNIVSHPMEEKYRTIKRSNPAFSRRLGAVAGGADLMLAAGFDSDFSEGVEYFVLRPSAEAWPRLTSTKEVIRRTLAEFDNARSAAPAAPGGMPDLSNLFPGGMPPAGGMGGMGGMPDAATMQNMLSDPNMLQNVMGMMNNPMIQNMIRSDPRLANNPMLQQSLEALRSNPDMINQFASMMRDPNVRDRVNNMMQGAGGGAGVGAGGAAGSAAGGGTGGAAGAADPFGSGPEAMRRQMEQFQRMSQQYGGTSGGLNAGGGGGGGSGTGAGAANGTGAPSGSNASGNTSNNANNAGTSDSDMTEEEMIAEAIARSLRES